ncbi:hypothetical protein BGZ94_003759 [Podila epigama]|nr:hypothetical protein BGZ94_003759 [Podila epigama]
MLLLRPLLVVGQSAIVANCLMRDQLRSVWKSKEACKAFLDAEVSSLSKDQVKEAIVWDESFEEQDWPSFTDEMGTVKIIYCRPGPTDAAIFIPERHTGNIAYNPELQGTLSILHFYCKIVSTVAESQILKHQEDIIHAGE